MSSAHDPTRSHDAAADPCPQRNHQRVAQTAAGSEEDLARDRAHSVVVDDEARPRPAGNPTFEAFCHLGADGKLLGCGKVRSLVHDPFPVDESRNADPDADEFGSEPGDEVGEIRRHVFQPLKHRCTRVDRRAFELRENRAGLVHSGAENLGPADVESERERHGDETVVVPLVPPGAGTSRW